MGAPANFASPRDRVVTVIGSALHHLAQKIPVARSSLGIGLFAGTERRAPMAQRHLPSVPTSQWGTTRPRSRPAVLRGSSAARTRSLPSAVTGVARRGRGWHHHERERGPFGFSRWGRGKNCRRPEVRRRSGRAQRCSRSPRSPQEIHSFFFADRRTAYAENIKTTNKHIPVVVGQAVGTPSKEEPLQRVTARLVCLCVVPTVGMPVGTVVGVSVGTFHLARGASWFRWGAR